MKVCTKCGDMQELSSFSVTKRNEDGTPKYYNSWCNLCRAANNRQRSGAVKRKVYQDSEESGVKECRCCGKLLPFAEYSPAGRGKFGLAANCRVCTSETNRIRPKEVTRASTKAYRLRHPERHKAAHRLHQFKRRMRVAAASDGTVTDEVLKHLYATEECYWCKKITPAEHRTLEHIEELCSGGSHSINNIAMACRSCNSARKGRKK